MIRNKNKTCMDCKFAKMVKEGKEDFSMRNEHSDYECVNPHVTLDMMEKHDWELGEELAADCDVFESLEIDTYCLECDEKINGKKTDWKYWAEGLMEDIPTCSKECQDKLQQKLDKQAEEMTT